MWYCSGVSLAFHSSSDNFIFLLFQFFFDLFYLLAKFAAAFAFGFAQLVEVQEFNDDVDGGQHEEEVEQSVDETAPAEIRRPAMPIEGKSALAKSLPQQQLE